MNFNNKQFAKAFLYAFAAILLMDYILAHGGYLTICGPYSTLMVALSSVLIVSLLIWNMLRGIELAVKGHWKKSIALILCLIIVVIGSNIAIKNLAEISEKKAYAAVRSFLSKGKNNFTVQIDEEVEYDYDLFLAHYDPASIKLIYSYPPYGRYDFDIYPKDGSIFTVTLWVKDSGGSILIHKKIKGHR